MARLFDPVTDPLDTDWAFAQYEQSRACLPDADFPASSQQISNISEIADYFDVFFLDAFGVLNVGESVVTGALERVSDLQKHGKQVFVVTNGASATTEVALEKFRKLGFDFTLAQIIGSREVLASCLNRRTEKLWGVMAPVSADVEELQITFTRLHNERETYDQVAGFILLSSSEWSDERQDMLVESLRTNPRPVLVGNPDIVAPRETGFTRQAGWYAHDLARRTKAQPEFFGKPHSGIFELALSRINPTVPKNRIVMVGDSPHTDILGGAAFGIKTALVAGHGLFAGSDVLPYVKKSGIVPDWISTYT